MHKAFVGRSLLLSMGPMVALLATEPSFAQSVARHPDLVVPTAIDGDPMPGKRVRQFNPDYERSGVYHLLYLPTDWEIGKKYPVIVEYAGNRYKTSPGTVEGSNLGYGITAGKGVIWICMPYVNKVERKNQLNWWGDVDATVEYCIRTVKRVCENFGGDPEKVFIAGFSRGAIACNYIGLHDDEIASLWRGFICHSHYDGVRQWAYAASDRDAAAARLARLGERPQFISHEKSVDGTREYVLGALPTGRFTFVALQGWPHTDTWVLYDVPERVSLRRWFQSVVAGKNPSDLVTGNASSDD